MYSVQNIAIHRIRLIFDSSNTLVYRPGTSLNVCKVRENMMPFAGYANSWTDFINWAHYFGIIQQPNFTYITQSISRTPRGYAQGSHSHGKAWKKILSWKVMEKSLKMGKKIKSWKSWKSHGISLLLITNHAREVPILPYLQVYCSDLAMWGFRFLF